MIFGTLVAVIGVSICAGLVKIGLWYLNAYRLLLRSKCFRGPPALPFIGSAHLFLGSSEDIYKKLEEIKSTYQTPCRVWLGPRLFFIVNDPEHIKCLQWLVIFQLILLNSAVLEKDSIYNLVKPLLHNGLTTAAVPKWKQHRKALEPLFNRQALESLVQKIATYALKTVEKMETEKEGKEFDIYEYTSHCTFDTILTTSTGICLDAINDKDCILFHRIERVLDIIAMRIMKPWLQADFIFKYTSMGQTYFKDIKYIREFTMDNIKTYATKSEMREYIESEPVKSLIGLLLTSGTNGYKFTGEEIVDELVTIVGSGFETTANVLSQAIFILASYPEMQDKMYAEVCEIYGKSNLESVNITLQDVHQMEYTERFLKETLRFFPSVPNMARYLSEDLILGEYTLPTGCSVVIDLVTTHRNEKYWPKPLEFNPDRFLPNHPLSPQHPSVFMSFGVGPRNCIGSKYGIILMKVFLATVVSRYVIKTFRAKPCLPDMTSRPFVVLTKS